MTYSLPITIGLLALLLTLIVVASSAGVREIDANEPVGPAPLLPTLWDPPLVDGNSVNFELYTDHAESGRNSWCGNYLIPTQSDLEGYGRYMGYKLNPGSTLDYTSHLYPNVFEAYAGDLRWEYPNDNPTSLQGSGGGCSSNDGLRINGYQSGQLAAIYYNLRHWYCGPSDLAGTNDPGTGRDWTLASGCDGAGVQVAEVTDTLRLASLYYKSGSTVPNAIGQIEITEGSVSADTMVLTLRTSPSNGVFLADAIQIVLNRGPDLADHIGVVATILTRGQASTYTIVMDIDGDESLDWHVQARLANVRNGHWEPSTPARAGYGIRPASDSLDTRNHSLLASDALIIDYVELDHLAEWNWEAQVPDTPTNTATNTPTATNTATFTPTWTATATPTGTPSATPVPPTETPAPTPTQTPTPIPSATPIPDDFNFEDGREIPPTIGEIVESDAPSPDLRTLRVPWSVLDAGSIEQFELRYISDRVIQTRHSITSGINLRATTLGDFVYGEHLVYWCATGHSGDPLVAQDTGVGQRIVLQFNLPGAGLNESVIPCIIADPRTGTMQLSMFGDLRNLMLSDTAPVFRWTASVGVHDKSTNTYRDESGTLAVILDPHDAEIEVADVAASSPSYYNPHDVRRLTTLTWYNEEDIFNFRSPTGPFNIQTLRATTIEARTNVADMDVPVGTSAIFKVRATYHDPEFTSDYSLPSPPYFVAAEPVVREELDVGENVNTTDFGAQSIIDAVRGTTSEGEFSNSVLRAVIGFGLVVAYSMLIYALLGGSQHAWRLLATFAAFATGWAFFMLTVGGVTSAAVWLALALVLFAGFMITRRRFGL